MQSPSTSQERYDKARRKEKALHLIEKKGVEVGCLCGSGAPYKYPTMDNFLRELPRLDIDQALSAALARRYVEAFHIRFDRVRTLLIREVGHEGFSVMQTHVNPAPTHEDARIFSPRHVRVR